jgi:hypothetical protein
MNKKMQKITNNEKKRSGIRKDRLNTSTEHEVTE